MFQRAIGHVKESLTGADRRSRSRITGVRFDDSLQTVLAADASTAFGATSAWRQIVDLIGRGRAPASPEAMERLRELRARVPDAARAASARALAFAAPGAPLVALFAEEELAVAAPVLRTATLTADEWARIVPGLSPAARSVLRNRRDLPGGARRALESFGPVDFVLPYDAPAVPSTEQGGPAAAAPPAAVVPPPGTPLGETPFVTLGTVARKLPVVAEALRRAEAPAPVAPETSPPRFEIADLVARIDAFTREREERVASGTQQPSDRFEFHTDAAGVIRWVEGVARGAVIGVSLAGTGSEAAQVDGVAAGAFRRRSAFRDARLTIGGTSDAAGAWRVSAAPRFDQASGRFSGYRGIARRPRADESAAPAPRSAASESLRQLVHELRTPTNAIAGFAELIESEILGEVPRVYRDRAGVIRAHAADLIQAIDDLDTAARIEGHALELRPGTVPVAAMIARVADDLAPLARLRGAVLDVDPIAAELVVAGDDRAVERLVGRLMAALVSAGRRGERIGIAAVRDSDRISLVFHRPAALADLPEDVLLSIDAEREQEAEMTGAPLLGTGFALRLARNLAVELGGTMVIGPQRLTLRLPAALNVEMGQASIH